MPRGIVKSDSSSYLACCLQVLVDIPSFRRALLRLNVERDFRHLPVDVAQHVLPFLEQLQLAIAQLGQDDDQPISIDNLQRAGHWMEPNMFGRGEHDILATPLHYILHFMDGFCNNELESLFVSSLVSSSPRLPERKVVIHCLDPRFRELYMALRLSVIHKGNLSWFDSAPPVLMMRVDRSYMDDGSGWKKRSMPFHFYTEIALDRHLIENKAKSEVWFERFPDENPIEFDVDVWKRTRYTLRSVVIHCGGLIDGERYYVYRSMGNDTWCKLDYNEISNWSTEAMIKYSSYGNRSVEMLVYVANEKEDNESAGADRYSAELEKRLEDIAHPNPQRPCASSAAADVLRAASAPDAAAPAAGPPAAPAAAAANVGTSAEVASHNQMSRGIIKCDSLSQLWCCLQVLVDIPSLRKTLLRRNTEVPHGHTQLVNAIMSFNQVLQVAVVQLRQNDDRPISMDALLEAGKRIKPEIFGKANRFDKYLNCILGVCGRDVESVYFCLLVNSQGSLEVGNIGLDPRDGDLYTALREALLRKDVLTNMYWIESPPPRLLLLRVDRLYMHDGQHRRKRKLPFHFHTQISLDRHLAENKERAEKLFEEWPDRNPIDFEKEAYKKTLYTLRSVVIHCEDLVGGYYYVVFRNIGDEKWLKLEDNDNYERSTEEMMEYSSYGNRSVEMLVYVANGEEDNESAGADRYSESLERKLKEMAMGVPNARKRRAAKRPLQPPTLSAAAAPAAATVATSAANPLNTTDESATIAVNTTASDVEADPALQEVFKRWIAINQSQDNLRKMFDSWIELTQRKENPIEVKPTLEMVVLALERVRQKMVQQQLLQSRDTAQQRPLGNQLQQQLDTASMLVGLGATGEPLPPPDGSFVPPAPPPVPGEEPVAEEEQSGDEIVHQQRAAAPAAPAATAAMRLPWTSLQPHESDERHEREMRPLTNFFCEHSGNAINEPVSEELSAALGVYVWGAEEHIGTGGRVDEKRKRTLDAYLMMQDDSEKCRKEAGESIGSRSASQDERSGTEDSGFDRRCRPAVGENT